MYVCMYVCGRIPRNGHTWGLTGAQRVKILVFLKLDGLFPYFSTHSFATLHKVGNTNFHF